MSSAFQCATAPNTVFTSREELHEHYKSDWHRYNLRRRAAGVAPVSKEIFEKVRANAEKERTGVENLKKKDHVASKNRRETTEDSSPVTHSNDAAAAAPVVVEEEEQAEPETRLPEMCLFCDVLSTSVEVNLSHMHKHHGFVIHDMESVINLPGLMKHVSDKIYVGLLCLTCEKEFQSSAACVNHMNAKGHSKIPWEYEDELEEFLEFYHFKVPEESMSTMEVDEDTGELILRTKGSSISKRLGPGKEFKSLYRDLQVERSVPTSQEEAYSQAVQERTLQAYQRAGILTTSTGLLTADVKRRLNKKTLMLLDKKERVFHDQALKVGLQTNWLIKDVKAGTNRGVGHGVHG